MFCLLLLLAVAVVSESTTVMVPMNLTLCDETSENVSRLMTDVYLVQPQEHDSCGQINTSTPVLFRVTTTLPDDDNKSFPIVFAARSQGNIQTWQLPLQLPKFSEQFHTVERTLCSVPPSPLSQWSDEEEEVIIDVFTSSPDQEHYTIEVNPVEDAVMRLDETIQLEVSIYSPAVRFFEFPSSVENVEVQAKSDDCGGCFIISVQKAACPIDLIPLDGLAGGAHQSILSRGTLPVSREVVDNDSRFFLVVMVTNSSVCNDTVNSTADFYDTNYAVNVTIKELHEAYEYPLAISLPLIVVLLLGAITVALFLAPLPKFVTDSYNPVKLLCVKVCKKSESTSSVQYHEPTVGEDTPLLGRSEQSGLKAEAGVDQPSKLDHGDGDDHHDVTASPLDKVERELRLSHLLARRSGAELAVQYRVYGWNAITVGIFYGLPAVQFVLGQQLIVYLTGYQELCYYNFECSHPWGVLSAFNNIWSNIWYLALGIFFIIIVATRHWKDSKEMEKNTEFWSHGVPQFYGLYYAMGFALMLEACMSAFYHICPSGLNFQFDTAFMFIIGGLLTVKVLQSRHPDINANAFVAFFCFAIVIFLTMIGIYESSYAPILTRVILLVIVLIFIVIFCLSFYYFHNWQLLQLINPVGVFRWFKNTFTSWPKHKVRFIRLVMAVVCNTVVGVGMVVTESGVPTIVLGLFATNFLAFLLSYLFCKVVLYKEPWTSAALINLILLSACWGAAFYFFFSNVTNSELTPAESRDLNRPCIVLSFYDNHDVWHFLSACAMFFSFLFVLTLDDGLKKTATKDIHVF